MNIFRVQFLLFIACNTLSSEDRQNKIIYNGITIARTDESSEFFTPIDDSQSESNSFTSNSSNYSFSILDKKVSSSSNDLSNLVEFDFPTQVLLQLTDEINELRVYIYTLEKRVEEVEGLNDLLQNDLILFHQTILKQIRVNKMNIAELESSDGPYRLNNKKSKRKIYKSKSHRGPYGKDKTREKNEILAKFSSSSSKTEKSNLKRKLVFDPSLKQVPIKKGFNPGRKNKKNKKSN